MRRSAADTKSAILAAARERFGRDGYERTTIRAVAADAGIDPSMVMRYFGSKAELFTSVSAFDLRLPDTSTVPHSRVGRTLVEHFIDRWESDDSFLVLLRTAVTNEDAAGRMREIFADQLVPVARQQGFEDAEARVRVGLVAGQMLGIALCRYVLRLPPLVEMSVTELVEHVAPVLQRYLSPRRRPDRSR
ncbi:TetR family transcriptional regulator [Microlunatus sp. Gsoil 973]|uniref:TetR/AcrR family transcriptional regulator n=1 Tax=Microlunatus sp. Gsoil 973 TaxID=2672569 RepID=UPI0012B464FF|nr:TetR family transcriptional regulator [Microlunatus sp. Gsoil 973]QGN31507.1 TetR family transcriptional regulator [Microlunatus sp. Gsoil 973]